MEVVQRHAEPGRDQPGPGRDLSLLLEQKKRKFASSSYRRRKLVFHSHEKEKTVFYFYKKRNLAGASWDKCGRHTASVWFPHRDRCGGASAGAGAARFARKSEATGIYTQTPKIVIPRCGATSVNCASSMSRSAAECHGVPYCRASEMLWKTHEIQDAWGRHGPKRAVMLQGQSRRPRMPMSSLTGIENARKRK